MDEAKFIHRVKATQTPVVGNIRYVDEVEGKIESFLKTPTVRTYMQMKDCLEAFTGDYRLMLELIEKFQLSPAARIEILQWGPYYLKFSRILIGLRQSSQKTIEEMADLVSRLMRSICDPIILCCPDRPPSVGVKNIDPAGEKKPKREYLASANAPTLLKSRGKKEARDED